MTIFKRNKKAATPKTIKPIKKAFDDADRSAYETHVAELEAALAQEKLQHKTARENFADAVKQIQSRVDENADIAKKNALIDEFIVETLKFLPSSDLVRRAREHRGA